MLSENCGKLHCLGLYCIEMLPPLSGDGYSSQIKTTGVFSSGFLFFPLFSLSFSVFKNGMEAQQHPTERREKAREQGQDINVSVQFRFFFFTKL